MKNINGFTRVVRRHAHNMAASRDVLKVCASSQRFQPGSIGGVFMNDIGKSFKESDVTCSCGSYGHIRDYLFGSHCTPNHPWKGGIRLPHSRSRFPPAGLRRDSSDLQS